MNEISFIVKYGLPTWWDASLNETSRLEQCLHISRRLGADLSALIFDNEFVLNQSPSVRLLEIINSIKQFKDEYLVFFVPYGFDEMTIGNTTLINSDNPQNLESMEKLNLNELDDDLFDFLSTVLI